MKYKKVPNNENVIEIDGKVVLSFDIRYKEYLQWKDENPNLEEQLIDELKQEIENKWLYNNGAPHKEGPPRNNVWKWYHKNGQLSLTYEMMNGKKDGVEKGVYDNGGVRSIVYYKNGKKHGKLQFYHQYKDLIMIRSHRVETYKDGKLYGEYIDYHLNNKERAKGNMKYGMMDGKWTFWYHNGKKELECEFDFGNPVGRAIIYHDNGVLKEVVSF